MRRESSSSLQAVDSLDMEAVSALFAPDVRLLALDGRHAKGKAEVGKVFTGFCAMLRAATHRITAEWHLDNVCIAEVEANYELRDWGQINALPRAFVLRDGPDGIADVHVYEAHEHPLTDHRTDDEGVMDRESMDPTPLRGCQTASTGRGNRPLHSSS
jgi:hypothetical protein